MPTSGESSSSLPAWIYGDADFFRLEREKVFLPAWHLVCHVNDIPEVGDYQTLAMFGERAIVVRGEDGRIRAFHNVCRHRAARLLDGASGNCGRRVVCPYHAWTYALDGALVGVPFQKEYEDFERDEHGLVPIEHDEFGGFVFIRFRAGGPSLAEEMAPLAEEVALYRTAEMRPIRQVGLRSRAVNWKNATDNYVDGLHIRVAHPGLDSLVGNTYRLTVDRGVDKIFASVEAIAGATPSVRAYRKFLPEVSHLPEERRRMWTYWKLWPNYAFDVYPDQIDFMQFIPVSPTETMIREIAYALPDDRREMRAARYLNWRINREVNREDKGLIERVQDGMNSSSYVAGPLGRNEICLRSFAERMRRTIPAARLPSPPRREEIAAQR